MTKLFKCLLPNRNILVVKQEAEVTVIPILSDTMTENEEPVGNETVDTEAVISSLPSISGRKFLFFLN